MSSKWAEADRAEGELRSFIADLEEAIAAGRIDAAKMILACRRTLDLWIDMGGSSTDDPVIGFLGIETQTDHVLGGRQAAVGRDVDRVRFRPGSPDETAEVEDCRRWFLDAFKRDVASLSALLNSGYSLERSPEGIKMIGYKR